MLYMIRLLYKFGGPILCIIDIMMIIVFRADGATEKWFFLTKMSSNDTREVDIDHISVELALVSTDTRITILSNDMDLCRE